MGWAADANTNAVRVGLFPFVNLSGDEKHQAWSREFPVLLWMGYQDAAPNRPIAYVEKVLKCLTNNAWDGRQAVSAELAGKVARELKLQQMVLGSFKRSDEGWEVRLQIFDVAGKAPAREFEFKERSTQNLGVILWEKACAAVGSKPYAAMVDAFRKYPVANETIDRSIALMHAGELNTTNETRIAGLRALLDAEPNYVMGHLALARQLGLANQPAAAKQEAAKVVELMPDLCTGYLYSWMGLTPEEYETTGVQLLLQALKVDPGCPQAARILFPTWASQGKWSDLKPVAEKAHEARPEEPVSTIALAAALAGLEDRDGAWDLAHAAAMDEEPDPDLHAMLLQASAALGDACLLSRELLWLQRDAGTNQHSRQFLGDADRTFWIALSDSAPLPPPAARYSSEALQTELRRLLTAEEIQRVENPLEVTDSTLAKATELTGGLTNTPVKALLLFGLVLEEAREIERRTTNAASRASRPVCHQFASRLVSLARAAGLPAWLVHVDLSTKDFSGYHDRAAIELREGFVLQFDPSLKKFGSPRDRARVLDDIQAIAHHLLQNPDRQSLDIAHKLDPGDPWTQNKVVMELAKMKRVEEARRLWDGLGPECTNRWDYYYARGIIEAESSRNMAALDWMKRADALSPNNPVILGQLGLLCETLKDFRNATEYFERALKLGAADYVSSRPTGFESTVRLTRSLAAAPTDETTLRARAESGDLGALMLMADRSLKRGDREAGLNWLRLGALQGEAAFQANYGQQLYRLKGTNAAPEAVEWLRKAARQSFPSAWSVLASLLYQGKGIPKDEVEAALWAHVGAAQGDDDCRALLREMALFASPAALAEGKKQADAWRKEHSPPRRELIK